MHIAQEKPSFFFVPPILRALDPAGGTVAQRTTLGELEGPAQGVVALEDSEAD